MEWEARVSRRMHLHIEWVNSNGLLDGTYNSVQFPKRNHFIHTYIYVYVCIYVYKYICVCIKSLCCINTEEINTTVNQLHLNKRTPAELLESSPGHSLLIGKSIPHHLI